MRCLQIPGPVLFEPIVVGSSIVSSLWLHRHHKQPGHLCPVVIGRHDDDAGPQIDGGAARWARGSRSLAKGY